MLMHGLLLAGAARHPDRGGFHWVDRMGDFAGLLRELGVHPGDRVTIFAHNGLSLSSRKCR